MCLNHTRFLGLVLPLLAAGALTACGGEAFPEERINFSPGTVFEAEALPGAAELERRDGGVVLDQKHPTLHVSLPMQTKAGTTYALMCRSKAIEDAAFNWIEVESGGKIAGRVFPCTSTYTNKKVLLRGNGANELGVTLTLKEGAGCVIDSLRIYEASEAYYIKELCAADSRSGSEPKPVAPTDDFRDHAIQSALWAEARGKDGGMSNLRALVKRTAGWGADPETFRMMIGRYIEYLETAELPRQTVCHTSFEMHIPMQLWDEMEADPAFSDAWRLEIVNTFYLMARTSFIDWAAWCLPRYYRGYQKHHEAEWRALDIPGRPYVYTRENMVPAKIDAAQEFNKKHPFLPNNHMTNPACALLFAARYFERYNIPEVPIWNRGARWVMEPVMHSNKPAEDCSTYQWAMSIAAEVAITEGRMEFFAKDGPLWKFMDLILMATNNIGDGPGYGDVGGYPQTRGRDGPIETDIFDALVSYAPPWMTEEFRQMLRTQKRRQDYLGVCVHPLDVLCYDHHMDQRGGIPLSEKERFDKISFRQSYDPNDQYLLLDGISFGFHGHQDGNSILQFDDENRTWLVERGYPLHQPKYREGIHTGRADQHNTVTVARPGVNNGEESPLDRTPTFSGLLFRRDDEQSGATSTISRDLNGMDWTRHIVWAKEKYFVVFDELVAREAGPVSLTCRWRTIGEPHLKDHRFQVTQRPKPGADVKDRRELSFVLVHCDDAAESLALGIEPPKTWELYPYAGPEVHVLQERIEGDLKQGDRRIFINVFAVVPAGEENALQARRVNETTVEVTYRGRTEMIGPLTGQLHKP